MPNSKFIAPHIIAQIIDRSDLLQVVQDYVELKQKGASWWGSSPWANDSNHSFCVTPAKGIFKCFSSGKGGNVVKFVMEIEPMAKTWLEAMHFLAQKFGVEIEEELSDEQKAMHKRRETLRTLCAFAAKWFAKQLEETNAGQVLQERILEERGYDLQIIKDFKIGYAPDAWRNLTEFCHRSGPGQEGKKRKTNRHLP